MRMTKIHHIIIYLLVICLGMALGNLTYNFFIHKNASRAKTEAVSLAKTAPSPQPQPDSQTAAPPSQNSAIATPLLPSPEPPTLTLNGVFFEQGEGFALINNNIVRVGDEIEGAKVKEITITCVSLEFDGKTIKLLSPS